MNQDAIMIAALVFLVGVALFGRNGAPAGAGGIPDGYRYDPAAGAYTREMPDGSLRWLT